MIGRPIYPSDPELQRRAQAIEQEAATRPAAKAAIAQGRAAAGNLEARQAATLAEEAASKAAAAAGRAAVVGAQAQTARMAGRAAADLLPLYRALVEEAQEAAAAAVTLRRAAAATIAHLEQLARQEEEKTA